jgi:hypothetical protein
LEDSNQTNNSPESVAPFIHRFDPEAPVDHAAAVDVHIGQFADHDKAKGDAIDHSIAAGEPLFATDGNAVTVEDLKATAAAISVGLKDPDEPQPEAEDEAPKEQKPMTRKQWKELMRLYFTVRHPRVRACQHRLDMARDPRHNCENCWFAYFKEQGQLVQTADECFVKAGRKALEAIRGKRFTKYFIRFMATLARFRAEQLAAEAAQETNDSNSGQQSNEASGDTGTAVVSGTPDVSGQMEGSEVSRSIAE